MGDQELVLKEVAYDAAPQDEEYVITEVSYDTAAASAPQDDIDLNIIDDIAPPPPRRMSKYCKIIADGCGLEDGDVVRRYTITNRNNLAVQVMSHGATITSIRVPDKRGILDDIVLGFEKFEGYKSQDNPYFGATVGRVTGVIPDHTFSIFNEKYYVTNNFLSNHHANGGLRGFDRVTWNSYVRDDKLFLSYVSPHNEEGFPGDLLVNRSYQLTAKNELIIETNATCSLPTPVDITSHVDFNLSSHFAGPDELYKHYLMVNGDRYAQIGDGNILTGKLKKVGGTIFDLRVPRRIGRIIHRVPGDGYDHVLSLTKGCSVKGNTFAARLVHPDSGRFVEVITNQEALLIYTNNNLYAKPCYVEGYPISCWGNPNKGERNGNGTTSEGARNGNGNPSEGAQNGNDNPNEDEQNGNGDSKSNIPKALDKPLIGKSGAEYIRHCAIRLVPLSYPEPIWRHSKHDEHILYPGQTYTNITTYKFGVIKEKKPLFSDLAVPQEDITVVENEILEDKEVVEKISPEG